MKRIRKGIIFLLILSISAAIFAVEPDNKLPESDSIDITWDLTGSNEGGFNGSYTLKFTNESGIDLDDLSLQTKANSGDGTLKGTGTCYLEWEFFTPVAVEVSVHSSKLKGKVSVGDGNQSLDWHADISKETAPSSNAEFVESPSIGFVNESGNYGSENTPVKIFSYDPSNGLKDSGKAKFTITTEDASSLQPDSFTTILTAVVKAKESSSPTE